ncbi:MAG: hypothetical protein MI724_07915 [Spirochaetales bacterium]|nr:hypothetical protein [Spirochaetales bacterium]
MGLLTDNAASPVIARALRGVEHDAVHTRELSISERCCIVAVSGDHVAHSLPTDSAISQYDSHSEAGAWGLSSPTVPPAAAYLGASL